MLFCGPYGFLEMKKKFMTKTFPRRIYVLLSFIKWSSGWKPWIVLFHTEVWIFSPLLMSLDVHIFLGNQGLLLYGKNLPSTSLKGMWMGHRKVSLDQRLLAVCFVTSVVSFLIFFLLPLNVEDSNSNRAKFLSIATALSLLLPRPEVWPSASRILLESDSLVAVSWASSHYKNPRKLLISW